MADRVYVLDQGGTVEHGAAFEVLQHPVVSAALTEVTRIIQVVSFGLIPVKFKPRLI